MEMLLDKPPCCGYSGVATVSAFPTVGFSLDDPPTVTGHDETVVARLQSFRFAQIIGGGAPIPIDYARPPVGYGAGEKPAVRTAVTVATPLAINRGVGGTSTEGQSSTARR